MILFIVFFTMYVLWAMAISYTTYQNHRRGHATFSVAQQLDMRAKRMKQHPQTSRRARL